MRAGRAGGIYSVNKKTKAQRQDLAQRKLGLDLRQQTIDAELNL